MGYSWREYDNISSVIHDGREMEYRFVPAKQNPKSAPTFIILHGHGNYPPARAAYPDWNVFNPLDNFGFNGLGSWWLGENGIKFTIELFNLALEKALSSVDQTLSTSKLFIYGSSMGGYGALLHGVRIGAKGIYANVPQIKLLGSTYSKKGQYKYFRPIFETDEGDIHNDLVKYLSSFSEHPLYFICENRFGQVNYLREQCMSLIEHFNQNKTNYHLEINPTSGHNKNRRLLEVKKLFEQYCFETNRD